LKFFFCIDHHLNFSKEAKITFADFCDFIQRDTQDEFEEAKRRIESVSSDKTY